MDPAEFLGPSSPDNCVSGQIDTVTNAATQGVNGVMISNCAGDQIEPAVKQASDAGATVVSWDSPVPSGEGESVFIAQVDFDETGTVMADLALDILGEEGGEYAILSAAPDAANQNAWIKAHKEAIKDPKYENLKLVDTVYGNDDSEKSYDEALGLVDKHPNLKLIMAPTTVGIAAAGKAMTDEKLCDKVKVSGLGLPEEMKDYTLSGCAPKFALWSFKDLGYLAFYTAYGIATGQVKAEEGAKFEAGRLGEIDDREGPDPRQRAEGPDGTVHRLRQVERRRGIAERWTSRGGPDVERVCFILRVRQDRLDEYKEAPSVVWPEMLEALARDRLDQLLAVPREDGLLVGYLETEDFEAALAGDGEPPT